MDLILNIGIVFANAFIAVWYYIQVYFWQIVLFILTIIVIVIEYRQKEFLFVDDERKVI